MRCCIVGLAAMLVTVASTIPAIAGPGALILADGEEMGRTAPAFQYFFASICTILILFTVLKPSRKR